LWKKQHAARMRNSFCKEICLIKNRIQFCKSEMQQELLAFS
jgi:hypothetical protein